MQKGYLVVEVTTSQEALPVIAHVLVTGGEYAQEGVSDASGRTGRFEIDAPDREASLNPEAGCLPYATVDVRIVSNAYRTVEVRGVQIFAGETAILPVAMEPATIERLAAGEPETVVYEIPPNRVDNPGQVAETPPEAEGAQILDVVAIPQYVTVHLGRPSQAAQNVTVTFTQYIKNVCCSEIYPTWPENALRANIYCQISLVLNRIYTEWYRSKGYNFDITNSTSYDQYFVYGRNIFENVSKIVDEIFNTYIRKANYAEPFYAEYCNGTTATCPGLKQWGTVTLANQGYTPLGILRYYYGSEISLAQTDLVQGAEESYPGAPLSQGSRGASVATIQNQLNRIRQSFPQISALTADGIFGSETRSAVRQFQSIFDLTVDGIVGRATWYRINYIYVSVKKLAELSSEGITTPDIVSPEPSAVLRSGSTGVYVSLAQFFLNVAADYYSDLSPIGVDGVFGSGTRAAVLAFQRKRGLTADGVIGAATWSELYKVYYSYQNAINPNPVYPGAPLRVGSTGANVSTIQRLLNVIGRYFQTIPSLTIDGIFGSGTRAAVVEFQRLMGLTQDGVVGPDTWRRIVTVYTSLVN